MAAALDKPKHNNPKRGCRTAVAGASAGASGWRQPWSQSADDQTVPNSSGSGVSSNKDGSRRRDKPKHDNQNRVAEQQWQQRPPEQQGWQQPGQA
jgi:hypothetical protein